MSDTINPPKKKLAVRESGPPPKMAVASLGESPSAT